MSAPVLGVVPARLGSTRLPAKPLARLLDRPLIEWVWRRVKGMKSLDAAVVATDSEAVAEVCRKMGAPVEMTSARHPSGTDRVAEIAGLDRYAHYPIIVNVQGDEPLVRERHLAASIALVTEGGWDIGTCAAPILDPTLREDPSVVKVVRAASGRALYFSRAPVPFVRDSERVGEERGGHDLLRHVGIYAYSRQALLAWVALPPTPLERLERLEQLRPLEAGLAIGVSLVDGAGRGVDTPADLARVEGRLAELFQEPCSGGARV